MASRSVAPGAALLRASRVFSIPPPLHQLTDPLSTTGRHTSDTATLPIPTHLAITTPQSSLAMGDWGLKRPLPLRSTTKSSTPLIRIAAMDTFEHITEFASAADHALSLRKWQEMGIPLSTPVPRKDTNFKNPDGSGKSVFEDEIDSTYRPQTAQKPGADAGDARWKFSGPWLAGQSNGEFNAYVQKEVRKRKLEFQNFLKKECALQMTRNLHAKGAENGIEEASPIVNPEDITEEQLRDYVKELRQDRLSLFTKIRNFLDLPPSPSKKFGPLELSMHMFDEEKSDLPQSQSPYAESGPPKTHPSAGLAYSRTASTIFNHPEFGPQRTATPIQARIVMPKGSGTGNFNPALGVGGFVTDVPIDDSSFNTKSPAIGSKPTTLQEGLFHFETEKEGGSKVYVQPKYATVDPKGRVVLRVAGADREAVAIKEGKGHELAALPVPAPTAIRPGGLTKNLRFDLEREMSPGGQLAPELPQDRLYYGFFWEFEICLVATWFANDDADNMRSLHFTEYWLSTTVADMSVSTSPTGNREAHIRSDNLSSLRQPAKKGRKPKWTPSRERAVGRLYLFSTLPTEDIVQVLEDKEEKWKPAEVSVIHKMNERVMGLEDGKAQRKFRRELVHSPTVELDGHLGSNMVAPPEYLSATIQAPDLTASNNLEDLPLDTFSETPIQDILAEAQDRPQRFPLISSHPQQDFGAGPAGISVEEFLEELVLPESWNNYQWSWQDESHSSGIYEARSTVRGVSVDSSLRRRLSKYSSLYVQAISRIVKVHSVAESSAVPSIAPAAWMSIASHDRPTSQAATIRPGIKHTSNNSRNLTIILSGAFLKLDHSKLWVSEKGLVTERAMIINPLTSLFSVDIQFVDMFRNTALHLLAARDAPFDTLFEVLKGGVDGNAKNTSGQSFLHLLSRGAVRDLANDQLYLNFVLRTLDSFNVKFSDCDVLGRSFFHRLSQAANTSINRLLTFGVHFLRAMPARDVAGWDVTHDPEIETQLQLNHGFYRFRSTRWAGRCIYEKNTLVGTSLPSIVEDHGPQTSFRPTSELMKMWLSGIPKSDNDQTISDLLPRIDDQNSRTTDGEAPLPTRITGAKGGLLFEHARLLETATIAMDEPTIEDSGGRNGLQCVAEVSLVIALKDPCSANNPRKRRARDSLSIPNVAAAHKDSQPKPMQFRYELVWNLINVGVDLNNYDRHGNTVLMAFIIHIFDGEDDKNLTKIFQALIQSGANVHWRNRQGETALHIAVRLGRKVATKILLESDANVHARTAEGKGVMAVGETHYFKAREDPKLYTSIKACMALCRDYGAVAAPTMVDEWLKSQQKQPTVPIRSSIMTSSSLGPLTTTFTPPPSCSSSFAHVYISTDPGGTGAFGGPVTTDGCLPSNYQDPYIYYYSPGICPSGYTTACSSWTALGPVTEMVVTCCPGFGYSYFCVGPPASVTWVATYRGCGSAFSTMSTAATWISDRSTFTFTWGYGDLNAFGVQIRFQSSDVAALTSTSASPSLTAQSFLPTPTSTPSTSTSTPLNSSTSGGGLSPGVSAGIGVGVALAVLILAGAIYMIFALGRRSGQRNDIDQADFKIEFPFAYIKNVSKEERDGESEKSRKASSRGDFTEF
ncbi:hypothetical protein G7Y89_g8796 [Cudoniella acicularis]|uniref:Uncharacterized protein n=1 Tax=Cudoniella acicularis TaxID=354080 RepID=A0A8H4W0Q7_9HELO|nr:hypothetical protein G7Y89_g8796 [Cudoniella acicularis]